MTYKLRILVIMFLLPFWVVNGYGEEPKTPHQTSAPAPAPAHKATADSATAEKSTQNLSLYTTRNQDSIISPINKNAVVDTTFSIKSTVVNKNIPSEANHSNTSISSNTQLHEPKDQSYSLLWSIIVILFILLLLSWFRDSEFIRKITVFFSKVLRLEKSKNNKTIMSDNGKNTVVSAERNRAVQNKQNIQKKNIDHNISSDESLPLAFSNVEYKNKLYIKDKNSWYILGASSIGKSHISSNLPCQDNHYCKILDDWAVSVVCDGAGSAKYSNIGSQYIAEKAGNTFYKLVDRNKWYRNLPDDDKWSFEANKSLMSVYNEFARHFENKYDIRSLACTVIVVIITPSGVMCTHIGDGRAGYCNSFGDWKSLITPHKGAEANETIFITTPSWRGNKDFELSGVVVPESNVYREPINAFTLMSDGCEHHTYDCSKMITENGKEFWIDPNTPAEKFFNPLVDQIKDLNSKQVPYDEVQKNWQQFIGAGTSGLKDEQDDKTLIFGVRI